MREHYDIVIVGSGHAGAQTAINLRQMNFKGSIALFGREDVLPYERPPLSKEYMAKEKTFDRIQLRPAQFWADKQIALELGCNIVAVDPENNVVSWNDGKTTSYGKLVWAAGGSPRQIGCPGADLEGIHYMRTKDDIDAIIAELSNDKKITVIGAGYIGLEAAAVFRKLGHNVVLLEAMPRVLARVAGQQISKFYAQEHRDQGVDVWLDAFVDSIKGENGRVAKIHLAGGQTIACDLAIVGIGIKPNIEVLATAGAECENGVKVDEFCRTSLPDVYSVGDCAQHKNAFVDGSSIRLESVQNANDMAKTAARHICGQDEPYHALPWFWSNQYDLRLQTVGLSVGHDETVLRGVPSARSFSVVYLKEGRVIALDCVNAMKDYVQGRKLIEARVELDKKDLADTTRQLKDLL